MIPRNPYDSFSLINGDLTDEEALQLALQESLIPQKQYVIYWTDICGVCLEPLKDLQEQIGVFTCKHVVCKSCTEILLQNYKPCPFCRKTLVETEIEFTDFKNLQPITNTQKQPTNRLTEENKRQLYTLTRDERRKIVLENFEHVLQNNQSNMYHYLKKTLYKNISSSLTKLTSIVFQKNEFEQYETKLDQDIEKVQKTIEKFKKRYNKAKLIGDQDTMDELDKKLRRINKKAYPKLQQKKTQLKNLNRESRSLTNQECRTITENLNNITQELEKFD